MLSLLPYVCRPSLLSCARSLSTIGPHRGGIEPNSVDTPANMHTFIMQRFYMNNYCVLTIPIALKALPMMSIKGLTYDDYLWRAVFIQGFFKNVHSVHVFCLAGEAGFTWDSITSFCNTCVARWKPSCYSTVEASPLTFN
jgi:hypothetical protein